MVAEVTTSPSATDSAHVFRTRDCLILGAWHPNVQHSSALITIVMRGLGEQGVIKRSAKGTAAYLEISAMRNVLMSLPTTPLRLNQAIPTEGLLLNLDLVSFRGCLPLSRHL